MKHNTPVIKDLDGWEKHSLPLGNVFIGANVFGGMDIDLVVFVTN